MQGEVTRTITLPTAVAAVWRALTTSDLLSAWFGAQVKIDARRGGTASFNWPDGRERLASVEVFEPPRLLVLRWLPFERGPDGQPRAVPHGRMKLVLEADGPGTRLTVEESVATPTDRIEQIMGLAGTR